MKHRFVKYAVSVSVLIAVLWTLSRLPSQAATAFSGIDFSAGHTTMKFFNRNTGEVYIYSDIDGKLYAKFTLTELGKDMEEAKK